MQASKNGRKPYLFPQKNFVSMFYAIILTPSIILNRLTSVVRREIPHFFRSFFTIFLVYHDLKQKIRCIDAPKYAFTHRNLPESEKYI